MIVKPLALSYLSLPPTVQDTVALLTLCQILTSMGQLRPIEGKGSAQGHTHRLRWGWRWAGLWTQVQGFPHLSVPTLSDTYLLPCLTLHVSTINFYVPG